jgi:peptidoglycan/LPS O-acetylase OafA/YrhL
MSRFDSVISHNTEKLIEIDILKCAILLIILCHLGFFLNFSIDAYPSLHYAYLGPTFAYMGLSMFIFASGYTLASRYKSLKNKEDITQYFKKRIIRIYPIWWIGLLFEFIIFGIFHINPNPYSENFFSFMGLLYQFIGVHGFFKADMDIGGGHIDWFIGTIIVYYVIYAIIAKYARDDIEILIISLCTYIICYLYHILDSRFYLYYPVFLIGIFAGRYNLLNITHPYFSQISQSVQGIISYIAQASYATYVIHQPLLSVVKYFNNKLGVAGPMEICVVLITSLIVIIIGYHIQKWVSGFNYRTPQSIHDSKEYKLI